MADHSKIEWTSATWNPVRGCSIVSPGCTNCYAMKQAHRFSGPGKAYAGLTKMTKGGPVWTGEVRLVPELLDWPLRKRKPLRIFVNSMSDLFHEDVPDEFIDKVFAVMAMAPQHTFQILTKRADRMLTYMTDEALRSRGGTLCAGRGEVIAKAMYDRNPNVADVSWPLPNVWLGVSAENQKAFNERAHLLAKTPAAVRFLSLEPLLGPITWNGHTVSIPWARGEAHGGRSYSPLMDFIHWVIVGGESGPGARPFDIAWARSLRDQCKAVGVPFFLKQIGSQPRGWCASHAPEHIGSEEAALQRKEDSDGDCDNYEASEQAQPCSAYGSRCVMLEDRKGGDPAEWPEDLRVREYPA